MDIFSFGEDIIEISFWNAMFIEWLVNRIWDQNNSSIGVSMSKPWKSDWGCRWTVQWLGNLFSLSRSKISFSFVPMHFLKSTHLLALGNWPKFDCRVTCHIKINESLISMSSDWTVKSSFSSIQKDIKEFQLVASMWYASYLEKSKASRGLAGVELCSSLRASIEWSYA